MYKEKLYSGLTPLYSEFIFCKCQLYTLCSQFVCNIMSFYIPALLLNEGHLQRCARTSLSSSLYIRLLCTQPQKRILLKHLFFILRSSWTKIEPNVTMYLQNFSEVRKDVYQPLMSVLSEPETTVFQDVGLENKLWVYDKSEAVAWNPNKSFNFSSLEGQLDFEKHNFQFQAPPLPQTWMFWKCWSVPKRIIIIST